MVSASGHDRCHRAPRFLHLCGAPAGLSLPSQRVRLSLSTSTQRSVQQSEWVVFFSLSLPDRNLETSMRIHSIPFHSISISFLSREERGGGASPSPFITPSTQRSSCRGVCVCGQNQHRLFAQMFSMFPAPNPFFFQQNNGHALHAGSIRLAHTLPAPSPEAWELGVFHDALRGLQHLSGHKHINGSSLARELA